MATNVVKCSHNLVFSQNEEEFEPSELIRNIVSGVHEATAVAYADPSLPKLGQIRESM